MLMVLISMIIFAAGEIELQFNSLISAYNTTLVKIPIRSLALVPSILAFLFSIISATALNLSLQSSISDLTPHANTVKYNLLLALLPLLTLTNPSLVLISSLSLETILMFVSYSTETFTFRLK